jgi:DNA replication protein DnaC
MLTYDVPSPYTPISIYYDSRIQDIEPYKGLFKDLVNGDVTNGAHVEKLKNYNIYSIRIDGKGRILFTYSQINKEKCLVVLEVLENHEYDKSKFLKKNVLKKYLEENQPELESIDFESTVIAKELTPSQASVSFEMVYENKQSYIVLDPEQQIVFNAKTPFLIEGPPGSGKTTLAQSLIKQALELGQTVLYVTPCASLARAVRQELSECPEYDPMKVQVLVYDELLDPGLAVNGKAIFRVWYQKFANNNNRDKKKFSDFAKKTDQVYEEFKIISGFSKAEYTSKDGIGQKQTLLGLAEDDRKWLFDLYQDWKSYLEKYKMRLCDFYVFKKEEINLYDFIVVDEAQYLSHIPMVNLLSMAKNSNIVICSDRRQNPHDEKQKTIHFKDMLTKYQNGTVPKVISLLTHYRCPENIMNFALVFNDIRLQMATKQKSEPKIMRSKIPGGNVEWFEPDDLKGLKKIEEMRQNADVCVVTPEAFKDEAAKKLGITQIFTPEEVVGLEYKTVILYKILETQQMFQVNQWLDKKAAEVNCAADLSACFLATTRATDSIIMVQNSKEHKLATLIPILKKDMPAVNDETVQPIKMLVCSSNEEWRARAKQSFERGTLDDSKTILLDHLGCSEERAKEIIQSWQGEEAEKKPATKVKDKVVEIKSKHQQGAASNKKNAKPAIQQQKKVAQPVASPSKKKTILASQVSDEDFKNAVFNASNAQSDKLIQLLNIPKLVKAQAFTIPIHSKWGNALCVLIIAAIDGQPAGLLAVLKKYRNAFRAKDFRAFGNENAILVRGLAIKAAEGHPEALLELIDQYPQAFKTEDFTTCSPLSSCKDKTALWYLAYGTFVGNPDGLLAVSIYYANAFKAADFTACAQVGEHKGKSALWFLAAAVAAGRPHSFLRILVQYPNQFKAADFTACAQAGVNKGESALNLLLCGAAKGHPKCLNIVLAQYPELQMAVLSQGLGQLMIAAPILNQFQNFSLQTVDEVEECTIPVSPPFTNRS